MNHEQQHQTEEEKMEAMWLDLVRAQTNYCLGPGAIIGDGDRKRGVHAKPSKKTNVLFFAKIAPPSTS